MREQCAGYDSKSPVNVPKPETETLNTPGMVRRARKGADIVGISISLWFRTDDQSATLKDKDKLNALRAHRRPNFEDQTPISGLTSIVELSCQSPKVR